MVADAFNEADVQFAQMMIVHHQQADELADLAQIRAADVQLKHVATQIRAAQDQEITTMTGWLTAWGQPTAPAGEPRTSDIPGMLSEPELADLAAATGADFDHMFARMMIAHDNGAIQICRQLSGTGRHRGVKSLAATIEQTRTAEVATLLSILNRL